MSMEPTEAVTLGVVVSRLDGLQKAFDEERRERREDFARFRTEIRQFHDDKVSRNEWQQRNTEVDKRFQDQGTDISEIKQDLAARRPPWTSIVAIIISGVAVLWAILGTPAGG